MKSRYVMSVATAALGILPVVAQTQLVDLGAATGYAINNAGQVALSTGIYSNGTLMSLPALPGSTTPATPYAINASGQVAGEALTGPAGAGCNVPIEYTGGTLIDLLGPSACAGADPSVGPATGGGDMNYFLHCTAPGVAAVNVSTSVVWKWLPVTASISASPTTITAGQSTTLSWKSTNAPSCTATGGGLEDDWAGTKAANGSQKVTEAVALDASTVLTFGITCTSTISGLSDEASINVTEDQAPSSTGEGSGGGGTLNPLSLVFLAGIFALRRARIGIADRSQ